MRDHLAAHEMQTYTIKAPLATHFRAATCAEVECAAHVHGWVSRIDESTDLGQRQAGYIRHHSGRRFTETRDEAGLTVFTFPAEQTCFTEHKVPLHRPELFLVRGGNLTTSTGEVRRHANGEDWADDLQTHQQKIADTFEKG